MFLWFILLLLYSLSQCDCCVFIYLFANGHWGCWQFRAVTSKAAGFPFLRNYGIWVNGF
jgi:hypothetical protein